MNNNLSFLKEKPADETIVIADECGDSMWDAVLEQQIRTCDVKVISGNAISLLHSVVAAQECDATEAEQDTQL